MSFLRPTRPPAVEPHSAQAAVMLQELRFPDQRLEAIGLLRQFVRRETVRLREAHLAGASGATTARQFTAMVDRVIVESYHFLGRSPLFTPRWP